jgi:hypothetical protein
MTGKTPNLQDMEPTAYIQNQDRSGNWITISTTINTASFILDGMRKVQALSANARVRAVDSHGRILDIL